MITVDDSFVFVQNVYLKEQQAKKCGVIITKERTGRVFLLIWEMQELMNK